MLPGIVGALSLASRSISADLTKEFMGICLEYPLLERFTVMRPVRKSTSRHSRAICSLYRRPVLIEIVNSERRPGRNAYKWPFLCSGITNWMRPSGSLNLVSPLHGG